ncbi:glycosyltransferase, partial [Solirubrobacter deserti]
RGGTGVPAAAATRPRPGLARAAAAALDAAERVAADSPPAPAAGSPAARAMGSPAAPVGSSSAAPVAPALVSVGCRFVCSGPGERFLHPALLATLVYRYGPPDADADVPVARLMINGQCTAVRRQALLEAGGYREAAGHMTDDAAFARGLARRGWRVAFHDGGGLIDVDMYDGAAETWREWGRSIALPDVTSPAWRAADLAVVWLTLGLPWVRLAARRATRLDLALLALRLAMAGAFAPAYAKRGAPYWLSPLADLAAAVRLTWSVVRPARRWRGRAYG